MSQRQITNPLPLVALLTAVLMIAALVMAHSRGTGELAGYVLVMCLVVAALTLPVLGLLRIVYTIRSARLRRAAPLQTQALVYSAVWDASRQINPRVIQFPAAHSRTTVRR